MLWLMGSVEVSHGRSKVRWRAAHNNCESVFLFPADVISQQQVHKEGGVVIKMPHAPFETWWTFKQLMKSLLMDNKGHKLHITNNVLKVQDLIAKFLYSKADLLQSVSAQNVLRISN